MLAACILGSDRKDDAEALEVDDNKEDKDSGQEVGDIGKVLPVEGLAEGTDLVSSGDQKVE